MRTQTRDAITAWMDSISPPRELDPGAVTVKEFAISRGYKNQEVARQLLERSVTEGKSERCWKFNGKRTVSAYRPVRK